MHISQEQADYLLRLPKKIVENQQLTSVKMLDQVFPMKEKFELLSEEDADFSFVFEINQSSKQSFKLTLHHQEADASIGLLRIDYQGKHQNPAVVTEKVPARFHPYVGWMFGYHEHHVHYFVEGYPTLAWALPLTDDSFPVKALTSPQSVVDAVVHFARLINLKTLLQINPLLI